MGVAVSFSWTDFSAAFPELAYVGQQLATGYFIRATLLHRNDGGGPVGDAATQSMLLNLVVAHLATLNGPGPNGEPASKIVGRISDATQGSVSVSADIGEVRNSQAFWAQTRYGLEYWQATNPYRRARYLPNRKSFFNFPFR